MKRWKKILTSPITTVAAFALAAGLLLFSSIGGARAALTYFSEDYETNIEMHEIGVTLNENGAPVADGKLLTGLLQDGEPLKLGVTYDERLSVSNSGVINEYVRVNIHKYWLKDGEKVPTLSPDFIGLNLVNLGSDWILDGEATTKERTVLYYNKLLTAGSETPLFADKLTIDGQVALKVSETREDSYSGDKKYTTITTVYEYDGAQFCIEAKVDAVQEHNAEDAIWSAWGRRVTISDGVLSLD